PRHYPRPPLHDALPILASASSPLLMLSRGVIEALRDDPDQTTLARRLASETALSDVIGKALLLQRTLLAGQHEPHIESATPAHQDRKSTRLNSSHVKIS